MSRSNKKLCCWGRDRPQSKFILLLIISDNIPIWVKQNEDLQTVSVREKGLHPREMQAYIWATPDSGKPSHFLNSFLLLHLCCTSLCCRFVQCQRTKTKAVRRRVSGQYCAISVVKKNQIYSNFLPTACNKSLSAKLFDSPAVKCESMQYSWCDLKKCPLT